MNLNLFEETWSRAEMLKLGGTWIECLNEMSDGIVYLKIQGPEELILLPQDNPNL